MKINFLKKIKLPIAMLLYVLPVSMTTVYAVKEQISKEPFYLSISEEKNNLEADDRFIGLVNPNFEKHSVALFSKQDIYLQASIDYGIAIQENQRLINEYRKIRAEADACKVRYYKEATNILESKITESSRQNLSNLQEAAISIEKRRIAQFNQLSAHQKALDLLRQNLLISWQGVVQATSSKERITPIQQKKDDLDIGVGGGGENNNDNNTPTVESKNSDEFEYVDYDDDNYYEDEDATTKPTNDKKSPSIYSENQEEKKYASARYAEAANKEKNAEKSLSEIQNYLKQLEQDRCHYANELLSTSMQLLNATNIENNYKNSNFLTMVNSDSKILNVDQANDQKTTIRQQQSIYEVAYFTTSEKIKLTENDLLEAIKKLADARKEARESLSTWQATCTASEREKSSS